MTHSYQQNRLDLFAAAALQGLLVGGRGGNIGLLLGEEGSRIIIAGLSVSLAVAMILEIDSRFPDEADPAQPSLFDADHGPKPDPKCWMCDGRGAYDDGTPCDCVTKTGQFAP